MDKWLKMELKHNKWVLQINNVHLSKAWLSLLICAMQLIFVQKLKNSSSEPHH